jgi:nicotinamidase-related amidase
VQELVGVDMQEDFLNDRELRRCRDDLAMECNRLIAVAEAAAAPVFPVRTMHAADRSTWSLGPA